MTDTASLPLTPDVLIIGAGAAGSALAHALAPTGRQIVLLSREGFLPREAENWSPALVYGGGRYLADETWTDAARGERFPVNMYYQAGGNTKTYGAAMLRLRPRDFEEVAFPEGVSPAWPIDYEELAPYYDRAEVAYHVHGRAGADPFEPPRAGPFPHPPLAHDGRIGAVAEGLRAGGVRAFELPMGLRLNHEDEDDGPFVLRELFRAQGTETFDGYPDLTHLKADAETASLRPALRYPNVRLVAGARATRLVPSAAGTAVEAVEAEVGGAQVRFRAGTVVLAAGAINSAALLLASATDAYPEGLANTSGRVGRHLMRHTTSKFYTADFAHVNDTFFQKTLAVNDYYWGDPKAGPLARVPLGHIHLMGKHTAEMIARDVPDLSPDDARRLAPHSVDWWAQTEDLPLEDNRVTLGPDGGIRLHYTPTNLGPHAQLMDKLEAALRPLGFTEFFRVPMPLRVVNHQCGTLRMGTRPETSVVSPEGRAHDLANLFVADASVFPSSAATNPTLTIVAWAYRLADHLAAEGV
ncbi:MAG: FAD-dependent oxidoreductase [Rubricoccaceae bacterium]